MSFLYIKKKVPLCVVQLSAGFHMGNYNYFDWLFKIKLLSCI